MANELQKKTETWGFMAAGEKLESQRPYTPETH
jgi:hypothetical protein